MFLAALLPAQERGAAAPPAAVAPAEQVELAALLPLPASFGFTPRGAARFYSSDLGDYLAAAAAAYGQYGMVAMAHQAYQSRAGEFTVDLFDMGGPLNAFGIYAVERPPDCLYVEVGAEGYAGAGRLNFFQARYYVKISATGAGAPAAALLESMAKYVSQKIWTGTEMPREIAWFPARGMTPHSQRYLARSPMGREYLAPAATAAYRFDGVETTLLVSMAASPAEAAARVARLRQSFAKPGGAAVPGLPVEAWRGEMPGEGEMIVLAIGRNAVALVHPPAQPLAFLKQIAAGAGK